MNASDVSALPNPAHELYALRKQWWWLLLLGVAMFLLGVACISSAIYMYYTGVALVMLFGVMLIVAGIAEIVASFWAGQWRGSLVHILVGILYLVVGFIILDNPTAAMLALTLVLGASFMIAGLFRIVAALQIKFHNWGWPLLNGIVTLLLGILILKNWPEAGMWVLGLFIGIELIFDGLSWIMLALDVRSIRVPAVQGAPA
jgi:uncharacterized membrane protein HdeD (DUF308 family)